MELIQHGYSCEYEMNIFINIFFEKNEDGTVTTYFSHENDVIEVHTCIEYGGKSYDADYSYAFANSENDAKEIKKIYGCCCMKSFCAAARKIRDIPLPWGVMSGIRPAKTVRLFHDAGLDYAQIRDKIRDIYGVSDEKLDLAVKVAENEEIVLKRALENSVSLYIGIPFCPSRCLYCSFVSTDIKNSGSYMDEFCGLLCREIEKTGEILRRLGFSVQNIYIGGGTPAVLSPENLEKIFAAVKNNIDLSWLDEYTLEAGRPDVITAEKLICAKNGGVSRISINPQTLNDVTLKKIGRKHTADDFYRAFHLARKLGFDNINTDLIAGLPGENFEMFKRSIDEIAALGPENVTVHSMCIKRAAALSFARRDLTGYTEMNRMLSYAQKKMREIGKEPYYMYRQKNISGNLENVGYSDREHMSAYNINIMEEIQTIIALGGGGASKIVMGDRIERVVNFKEPYEYIRRFDEILDKKEEIAAFFENNGKGELS